MSIACVHSRALAGAEAPAVTVETHLANGLPAFNIVGLPEAEVREARDRVRAAILTSGFEFPARRITVNLAPADLPKDTGRFDLPIALGVLVASGQAPGDRLNEYEFAGELSLSGELRPVRGSLAMTYRAARCGRAFVLPPASAPEAALVSSARVYAVETLLAATALLRDAGDGIARVAPASAGHSAGSLDLPDLADVRGQVHAKRALEVAAAGGHSVLMMGPPGTGKSMLANRLAGIMPPLEESAALESAAMRSLASLAFDPARWCERPFRAPHHTASSIAVIGGGRPVRPGEVSLAHHGILFLDEMPEFDRRVLEVLREPLESGTVAVSRAGAHVEYPARFQLVGAMNPCPCGFRGSLVRQCHCTPDQVDRYRGKLSGPLLDRIDIHVEVPQLTEDEMLESAPAEPSAVVRARVIAAHGRQCTRQGKSNAALSAAEIAAWPPLGVAANELLRKAIRHLGLSGRGHQRIMRIARTIADLAQVELIEATHVAQAIQYRRLAGAAKA